MKKEYSLRKKYQFKRIIDNGKRITNEYLSFFYIESDQFKIGISIPKKLGNAVFRNKNKRQIKNVLDEIPELNSINKNIVLIAKKDFVLLNFEAKKKIILKEIVKIK